MGLFTFLATTTSTLPSMDWSNVDIIGLFSPVISSIQGMVVPLLTISFAVLAIKKGIAWIKGGVKRA